MAIAMDFGASKLQFLLLTVFLSIFSFPISNASLHVYNRESFKEVGNSLLLSGGSEGIAATRVPPPPSSSAVSATSSSSVRDGRAFIRFENVTFWRTEDAYDGTTDEEGSSGLVQVIIFEALDRDDIGGSAYGGQRSICCTPDLAKMEGCKDGEVIKIRSSANRKWPMVLDVHFHGDSLSAEMDTTEVYITKTGMYNLFFVSCDPKMKNGLIVEGQTLWKNPDGYVPGRMAPLKNFYVVMSVAYFLLSLMWFSQYVRFWIEVLQLQHCIAIVIVLSWFEMTLWYLDYATFNGSGVRPVAITTFVVTVGALRRTVSRILILCVSMGYGVVRPTLGGLTSKVILLGVTYFFATELLDMTEYVGTINDVSGRARVLFVIPDALLNAFLIVWIFTSLSKTLEQLQAKRSAAKLNIYRKFSDGLIAAIIASVGWIGYEVYFRAADPYNERWQSAWMITAFWDILAFLLLCMICFLWAPSQSSQRYAYAGGYGEYDDEEAQSLTREGDVILVKQSKEGRNGRTEGSSDSEDESEVDKGQ